MTTRHTGVYERREAAWLALSGLGVAAAAAGLFAILRKVGGFSEFIAGPVCLWWIARWLLFASDFALSQRGPWPRDRRSRLLAFITSLPVGWWIGHGGMPWAALAVLPVYALIERRSMRRLFPPDETGVYLPLHFWGTLVVLGESLGFALGRWLS